MGWSYGIVDGREVGYSVQAECDHPECNEAINRGLSYCCGDMPGDGITCGGFFCEKHLNYTGREEPRQACDACLKELGEDDEAEAALEAAFDDEVNHG